MSPERLGELLLISRSFTSPARAHLNAILLGSPLVHEVSSGIPDEDSAMASVESCVQMLMSYGEGFDLDDEATQECRSEAQEIHDTCGCFFGDGLLCIIDVVAHYHGGEESRDVALRAARDMREFLRRAGRPMAAGSLDLLSMADLRNLLLALHQILRNEAPRAGAADA